MSDESIQGSGRSGNLKSYKKGQSGNPGGQPKWLKEVREAMRTCVTKGAARLQAIIEQGEDRDAVAAVKVAAEYSLPKPKQTHRLEHKGDPLATLTPEQLVEFIKGKKE